MLAALTKLVETNRILVRAPRVEDFEGIVRLWTDPEVTEYIGGPREIDALREHFEGCAADPQGSFEREQECWWSIIERSTRAFAGLCALVWKDIEGRTEIDLGYFLLKEFQGRGYAGEAVQATTSFAFGELGLPSVIALIHPDNRASIRVAERLGMFLDRQILRPDGVVRCIYRLNSPAREESLAR